MWLQQSKKDDFAKYIEIYGEEAVEIVRRGWPKGDFDAGVECYRQFVVRVQGCGVMAAGSG